MVCSPLGSLVLVLLRKMDIMVIVQTRSTSMMSKMLAETGGTILMIPLFRCKSFALTAVSFGKLATVHLNVNVMDTLSTQNYLVQKIH